MMSDRMKSRVVKWKEVSSRLMLGEIAVWKGNLGVCICLWARDGKADRGKRAGLKIVQ